MSAPVDLVVDLHQTGNEHAMKLMERLGITYQKAVPQSLGDCWWFFGCLNVPDKLPSAITLKPATPMTDSAESGTSVEADDSDCPNTAELLKWARGMVRSGCDKHYQGRSYFAAIAAEIERKTAELAKLRALVDEMAYKLEEAICPNASGQPKRSRCEWCDDKDRLVESARPATPKDTGHA